MDKGNETIYCYFQYFYAKVAVLSYFLIIVICDL